MKVRTIISLLSLSLLLGLSACSYFEGSGTPAAVEDLEHHRYEARFLNNEKIDLQHDVASELSFGEDLHISGKACNRFAGKANLENGVLTAPNIAATRMFCAEESLNAMENALFTMFRKGGKVTIEGENLFLSDDENTITFVRRDLLQ